MGYDQPDGPPPTSQARSAGSRWRRGRHHSCVCGPQRPASPSSGPAVGPSSAVTATGSACRHDVSDPDDVLDPRDRDGSRYPLTQSAWRSIFRTGGGQSMTDVSLPQDPVPMRESALDARSFLALWLAIHGGDPAPDPVKILKTGVAVLEEIREVRGSSRLGRASSGRRCRCNESRALKHHG